MGQICVVKREPKARKGKKTEKAQPRNVLEEMNLGGCVDPKGMPSFFFSGAKSIQYQTAQKADVTKQNCSVTPRFWYIDCTYDCAKCRREFTWTAREQKVWFEQHQIFIDARPWLCMRCRGEERHQVELRKEYDASVAAACEEAAEDPRLKLRIVWIVRELQQSITPLPKKMLDTVQLFERQISRDKQNPHGNLTRYLYQFRPVIPILNADAS